VRIQLLHVPGCPLVDQLRARVSECLAQAGMPVPIEETEGPYPSPTLLVDGTDAATGQPPTDTACCRLDLPTHMQILDTLHRNTP